jgi:hypothetical protein
MIFSKDQITGRIHKESLIKEIIDNKKSLDQLKKWSLEKEDPLGWRATWLLRQVCQKNDPDMQDLLKIVVEAFPSYNESHKREWLKVIKSIDVSEEHMGILFDYCITEWQRIHNHSALRMESMLFILRIVNLYPELRTEIDHLLTKEYLDPLSPGIRKSLQKQVDNQ